VIAAALAAATRRVKIGIAAQVLPLSHPCAWPRTSRLA
jgi:alkanesulfonate monooxygenase SsuD/methylene tetrahydromethanopterin reductase-like flavin-dependent oxidoreductase (luciferase family)